MTDIEMQDLPQQQPQQPVYYGPQPAQQFYIREGDPGQIKLVGAANYSDIPKGRPWVKAIVGVSAVDAAIFVAIIILWGVGYSAATTVVLISLLEILIILKMAMGLAAIPYIYLDVWEPQEGGVQKQQEVQHTSRGLIIFYLIVCAVAVILSIADLITRVFLYEDCGPTSTLPCYTGFIYNMEITFMVLAGFEVITSIIGVVCGGVVYVKLTYFKTIWLEGKSVPVTMGQIGGNNAYAIQGPMPTFTQFASAPYGGPRAYTVDARQANRAPPGHPNWSLSSGHMMMGYVHNATPTKEKPY